MGDHRHQNRGSKEPLLDDMQQAYLWQALQSAPPDGGQWNGRKVADWIAQLIGRSIARQRGWEYLRLLRLRLRVPRPQHHDANPQEQEEWKKKSGDSSRPDPAVTSRLRRSTMGLGVSIEPDSSL